MLRRILRVILALLVALDQLIQVCLWGLHYIALGGDRCPSPDETISSRVGKAAMAEKQWALLAERAIDGLFSLIGQDGHCRRNLEADEGWDRQ